MPHGLGNSELHQVHVEYFFDRARVILRRAADSVQVYSARLLQRRERLLPHPALADHTRHREPEHAVVARQRPVGERDEQRRFGHGQPGGDRVVDAGNLPDPAVELEVRLGSPETEDDQRKRQE